MGGVEQKIWGGKRESNPQPSEPQSGALPVELFPPLSFIIATSMDRISMIAPAPWRSQYLNPHRPRNPGRIARLRFDLEYRAPDGRAATARRAIEIASAVENQAIEWTGSVHAATAEAVQRGLGPATCRRRRQPKGRAVAAPAV